RLVQRVPRRPEAVEVEGRRSDRPLRQLVEGLASPGARAEIAVAVPVLDGFQLADDIVGAFLETSIAGGGPHQADGRQVMAGDVSGQVPIVAIPSAVRRRLGLEAGACPVEG